MCIVLNYFLYFPYTVYMLYFRMLTFWGKLFQPCPNWINVASSSSSHVEAKHEYLYKVHSGSNVTTCHLDFIRNIFKCSDVWAQYYITVVRRSALANWQEWSERAAASYCRSALIMSQIGFGADTERSCAAVELQLVAGLWAARQALQELPLGVVENLLAMPSGASAGTPCSLINQPLVGENTLECQYHPQRTKGSFWLF